MRRPPLILGEFVSVDEVQELFNLDDSCQVLLAVNYLNCLDGFVYVLFTLDNTLFHFFAPQNCLCNGVAGYSSLTAHNVTTQRLRAELDNIYCPANNTAINFAIELRQICDDIDADVSATLMAQAMCNQFTDSLLALVQQSVQQSMMTMRTAN